MNEVDLFNLDGQSLAADLYEMTWGYRIARVLHVAVELELFDRLADHPATAAELAEQCETDPAWTEKLCIACTALGLLYLDNDVYRNSLTADLCLVFGRPLYQGNGIRHNADLWTFFTNLDVVVREGYREAAYEHAERREEDDRHPDFILAMHNLAVGGRAQALANSVDFSGRRHLLDVGGGPGTYSIALCQRYPDLQAMIFDQPKTLEITRQVIADFGMNERISTVVGDWNENDFGEGYDTLLMSNILHGPNDQADMKLGKAYAALQPGGMLVIQDFLLENDKTGPLMAALFNLQIGAYTVAEMLAVITEAGFTDATLVMRGPRGNGVVTARK